MSIEERLARLERHQSELERLTKDAVDQTARGFTKVDSALAELRRDSHPAVPFAECPMCFAVVLDEHLSNHLSISHAMRVDDEGRIVDA